jgi:hypothetical protein
MTYVEGQSEVDARIARNDMVAFETDLANNASRRKMGLRN